ncbi:hypothetical protein [Maricaulis maris]|uniref:hypothetical protein n=2 Tax=Maricaulis TaxID=74317 RepID=UPI0030C702F5
MFNRFNLSLKFGLISIAGCLTLGLALGVAASVQSSNAARASTQERLTAIVQERQQALVDYMAQINDDLATTATNPNTLAALAEFSDSWTALGPNAGNRLQRLYIEDNPNPTGQKENLDRALDDSRYSAAQRTDATILGSANSCARVVITTSSCSMQMGTSSTQSSRNSTTQRI